MRVISILQNESPNDLPPLPIIPYALSTAMSVAYRQFRQSKLLSHRNRGKEDLKTCCALLNRLRTSWWSAGAMADLGHAALKKAGTQEKGNTKSVEVQRSQGVADATRSRSESLPMVQETDTTRVLPQRRLDSKAVNPMDSLETPQAPRSYPEDLSSYPLGRFEFLESPDWLNFDAAFENMDTLLGSSGADQCTELFRSFNYEAFG